MPIRFLRQIFNNEKVIQEMADSAPMRAAAKQFVRGMKMAEEKVENLQVGKRVERFKKIYEEERQKQLK